MDAADIGFVHDVGGDDLQRHRLTPGDQRPRRRRRRVDVGGEDQGYGRDAIGLQQLAHRDGVEPRCTLAERVAHDPPRALRVGREVPRQRVGGAHQIVLRLPVTHEVQKAFDRLRIGGELRDARACEGLSHRLGLAEGYGEDRLLAALALTRLSHRLGDGRGDRPRVRADRRNVDRQHGVAVLIGQQRLQRLREGRAARIHAEVDRVALRVSGQDPVPVGQPVGGQKADAEPVGEDREPLAGKGPLPSQGLDGGEHLVEILHREQARPPEGGGVDRIGPSQRPRMGDGGIGRGRSIRPPPSRAQHHHGLRPRRRAGGGHEAPRILHAVEAEQDRAGADVGREMVQAVGSIDIHGAAERHHRREADLPRLAHSAIAAATVPDCEISARSPTEGACANRLASSFRPGTQRPALFGPRRRRPWARAALRARGPGSSGPVPSPALRMMAAAAPIRPASSTTSGTCEGGTAITTRSGTVGSAERRGAAGKPSISLPWDEPAGSGPDSPPA